MEPGVYKDETGNFGYLNPAGTFIGSLSRSQARNAATTAGLFTTLRGVYVPPKGHTSRRYRNYNWLSFPIGCTILTCDASGYKNIREAARLFQKKNPTFDFSVTTNDGIFTFRREALGKGNVPRKTISYPWRSAWNVGDVMYTCSYKARLKTYAACFNYARKHPEFGFVMSSEKERDTASFIQA